MELYATNRLNRVSANAPKAPTIKEPAAKMVSIGVHNVEKNSRVEARERANIPNVAILTGIIIKAVIGGALPS
jgi:hypothetical protein